MNWDQQWFEIILVLLLGGAPATLIAMAIAKWRRKDHTHMGRYREGKGRSPWRD